MTEFDAAREELTALLSLHLHEPSDGETYEKSAIIRLLRGWEKRHDSHVVERCLAKLSNKSPHRTSSLINLWLFEQKLRHPSAMALDVQSIWPSHLGSIPKGGKMLALERLKLSLNEDAHRTRMLIETMSEYTDVFDRILKTSQGSKILTSILNDFLTHPQKEMKDNFHAFPVVVLSKCAIQTTRSLEAEIQILELFEQNETVDFTKKEGSIFFVKNILPLIKKIDPKDFSEKVALQVQEFLWHNVSTPHWSKILNEMRSVGWPDDRLSILMCVPPSAHRVTEHQKSKILMPLWMASEHHREELMESVCYVACNIPNSTDEFSNLKNMLVLPYFEALAQHQVLLDQVGDHHAARVRVSKM